MTDLDPKAWEGRTPGDWRADSINILAGDAYIGCVRGTGILSAIRADAALIAAAPTLAAEWQKEKDRADRLESERDEALRRRDEWRRKAEGFDDVRKALREKIGEPWPPTMSRALWAGIAADQKKRADDAEAERDRLREALEEIERLYYTEGKDASWRAAHMRAIATDAIEARAALNGEQG